LAIFTAFLAYLITYRHYARQDSTPAGDRPQNAVVMSPASTGPNPAEAQEQNRLRIDVGYGNLPLSFEPNRGQTDSRVKFVSRAGKHTLWLTKDEAVLAVGRQPRTSRTDGTHEAVRSQDEIEPAILRMRFVGANVTATIRG